METVVRWQREADGPEDLEHHGAGMGVVHGASGDLLVPERLASPWLNRTMQAQRAAAQRKGGGAQVLYRVWGSGLDVVSDGGKVNAQNATVFDQPLRMRAFRQGLVRLEGVGFPGEDNDELGQPQAEQTVLGFRWPPPQRSRLPQQTRPIQEALTYGVLSPSCAGCVLFGEEGQLTSEALKERVRRKVKERVKE